MDKKISVIIPVYNLENYINDCLNSVIAQTYHNLEIILINDGSTDDSESICRKFAETDSRIKFISQKNGGLSEARNNGIIAATGDFIAFVDGDDILHRDYFSTLISCAEKYNADVAVIKYIFIKSCEEFNAKTDLYSGKEEVITPREAVLRIERDGYRYMITAWGKLFKASLKNCLFFPAGKLHEDEYVLYKVLFNANKVVVSDNRYYGYRKRGDSIMTHFSRKRMSDLLEGLREAICYFRMQEDKEICSWAIRRYLLRITTSYYWIKNDIEDDPELANEARTLFSTEYKMMKSEIRKGTPLIYAAAYSIFKLSPGLYCKFADVFLHYSKDDL